jgi:hypothetical protein
MTHEFKDVVGDTYLSIDTSQPIITIDNPRLIEPRVEFNMGEIEPVLVISAGGKVTWNGREVVGDEEFKQAMMDLNVKLGGINKTIQPAQEPVGYLIEYEHLSGTVNRGGSSRKFDEVWTLNSFLSEFEDAEIDATKWRNKKVSKVYTHPAPTMPALTTKQLAELITGMSVSVDVSTCDADAGNRYFGAVTEIMEAQGDKHGVTLLVQDAEPNFKVQPAMTYSDLETCRKVANRTFRYHKSSVKGQQVCEADDYEWHLAKAVEAHCRGGANHE